MTHDACYQVLIIGGGPAGLAAGLYTARYGLRTLIVDAGKSLLRQCAYLDNYLGFPGGVDAESWLELSRTQVRELGAELTRERVASVQRSSAGFVARTASGRSITAERIVAASSGELSYLRELGLAHAADGGGFDAEGRSALAGVYGIGQLTGLPEQAQIAAGLGAYVALGLIRDQRAAEGLAGALAAHYDWQVRAGIYDSPRWAARVHKHFAAEDASQIERWIAHKRTQQLTAAGIQARRARAARLRERILSEARGTRRLA